MFNKFYAGNLVDMTEEKIIECRYTLLVLVCII